MGIAVRTGSPLSLNLAEPMWKLLAGSPLAAADLAEVLTYQHLIIFSIATNKHILKTIFPEFLYQTPAQKPKEQKKSLSGDYTSREKREKCGL